MTTKVPLITFNSCLLIAIWLLIFSSCENQGEQAPLVIDRTNISVQAIDEVELVLNAEKGLVFFKDEPFSGSSIQRYSSGAKSISIEYYMGKKNGLYRKWFKDGQISFESNYTNGKKQGATRSWWKNGNLRSLSKFEAGIANGLQQQWYKSGAKFKEIRLEDGKEKGLQKSWRENGKIYNNYEARNGRIFGLKRANLCYELDDEVVQYKNN